jgi:hypothetical protein
VSGLRVFSPSRKAADALLVREKMAAKNTKAGGMMLVINDLGSNRGGM